MTNIEKNEIVQLDPEKTSNQAFAGCLMIVTDVKPWGVQGYIQTLGGLAYYRAENGTFARTGGKAAWIVE